MSDDMLSLLLLMRAWKSEKALNHDYKKQNDPKQGWFLEAKIGRPQREVLVASALHAVFRQ